MTHNNTGLSSSASTTTSTDGIVVAQVASRSSKPASKTGTGLDDLLQMIDQAETSVREHFQRLRKGIQQVRMFNLGTAKLNDNVKQTVERLLEVERQNMSLQRAQEQEQLRATMQQLADAWQRLEQEQLAQRARLNDSHCTATSADTPSKVAARECPESETRQEQSMEERVPSRSLTDLGFQPTSPASVAVSSIGNEQMFHKLRSDLLRRSSAKS